MLRKFFVLLGFMGMLTYSTMAQNKIPKEVRETFTGQYADAEDAVYQDKLLNIVVNFTLKGDKMTAYYTRKGQWKYTEKDFSFDQLPEEVKDGYGKSKYTDWTIEETKIIYKAGGTERYRVKVKKNDLQKKYLFFNKEGQLEEDSLTV